MGAFKGDIPSRRRRNLALATAGLLLIVVASFFSWRAGQRRTALGQLDEAEQQVLANYRTAIDHFAREEIGPEQFTDAMETHVLAPWRELQAAERKLREQETSDKVAARLDHRLKAMKLREQAWGLLVDSVKQGDKEAVRRAVRKNAEADQIETDLEADIKAEREAGGK
jgi:hypothetical protein